MCTVSYIPQGKDSFVLTSNRDVNSARSPKNITRLEQNGQVTLFPQDEEAGGTWIAISNTNKVVCLLNGAFENHEYCPPYKQSRGLLVLDFFTFPDASVFFERYDFEGIEPFTMVVFDEDNLFEFRWNGEVPYIRELDTSGFYLWSSATLYPKEIRERRQSWFQAWLNHRTDFGLEAIRHFHRTGGKGDSGNGFIMNRNNLVQTVSITHVVKKSNGIEMIYHDLLNDSVKSEQLEVQKVFP